MPWRKYKPKNGKYGPTYYISNGIQVRCNSSGKWILYIRKRGERKNKTIGSGRENLAKAIKAAETIVSQINTAYPLKPVESAKSKTPLFKEYSDNWLNGNTGRWDEYTYMRYEGILRLHLWPYEVFKGKRLDEITRTDIKNHLRVLLKTQSPSSVEVAHTVICSIFEEAVDDEVVLANPAKGLLKKLLPPQNKRNVNLADPLDMEERDRFLDYAEKICSWPERLILKVMVHAGFRLGEALAMRLKNLDLKKMTYYVSESYKQYRFGLPKKGKKRFVDLPAFLVEELNRYIHQLKKERLQNGLGGEIDLLFPDPRETGCWPYSQRKVQTLVKRACKGAQLILIRYHRLKNMVYLLQLKTGGDLYHEVCLS